MLQVVKKNQYGGKEIFKGTLRQVLNQLRAEAAKRRRESRQAHNLPDDVMAIESRHPSKLVNMASFGLNSMNLDKLLVLLNNHGVENYEVIR
jgi:hypothetical protein